MSVPDPVRLRPDDPRLAAVLRRWEQVYGAPPDELPARLADGRSVVFATFDGDAPAAFAHFRDHKAMLLQGPAGADETARLLAESPEFAAYTFEQLYFAGGRWTLETGGGPIFRAMAEHLRTTAVRWTLVGHLHSDRPFFAESCAFLESLGWRRRPGDYLTYRLDLPDVAPDGALPAGPYRWRFLGEPDAPEAESVVRVYAAVFPDDPPADVVRADLAAGRWGPLSGVAGDDTGRPVAVVLTRTASPGVLQVDRLGTLPALRGRGVVSHAFLDFVRRCRAAGCSALSFQVRATNAAATGLVAMRLGARVAKEERFYVLSGAGDLGGAVLSRRRGCRRRSRARRSAELRSRRCTRGCPGASRT